MKKFFYNSKGKLMPVYVYMFIMMVFVFLYCFAKLTDVIIRLCMREPLELSDLLLITLIGGVVGWAKMYNDGKRKCKQRKRDDGNIEVD